MGGLLFYLPFILSRTTTPCILRRAILQLERLCAPFAEIGERDESHGLVCKQVLGRFGRGREARIGG